MSMPLRGEDGIQPCALSHSAIERLTPTATAPCSGLTKRSTAMAMMAGPAISVSDDRITRPTDIAARRRYGRRYRSSRRARRGSKALAPSSWCRSMSAMIFRGLAVSGSRGLAGSRGSVSRHETAQPRDPATSLSRLLQLLLDRLPPVQVGVVAVVGQERLVGAALDDLPLLDDDDVVGVLDRGDAVRNDQHRPPLSDLSQRPQDLFLGRRIDGA